MKKFLIGMICMFGIVACDVTDDNLTCGQYDITINMSADGDTLDMVVNGDSVQLVLVPSGSGARYAGVLNDTNITMWNKGREWTLFLNDEDPISCK